MTAKNTRRILNAVLGDYPHTAAIKSGAVSSDGLELRFTDYKPTHDAFRLMIRERKFDICEMALVTFLLAKTHGKPMLLLPAVMIGRFQQPYAMYNPASGVKGPDDIAGRRVGVRSNTTTTVTWLRGILANDYGADLDAAHWVTFEEPHVPEYVDPTERAPAGKKIIPMLIDGELDVVIGDSSDDPQLKPLFADPDNAAREWYAKHKVVPVNHLVVVSEELARSDMGLVAEFYRMLKDAKATVPAPASDVDSTPLGLEKMRASIDMVIGYAFQQRLIPRHYEVDELFDERVMKAIGE